MGVILKGKPSGISVKAVEVIGRCIRTYKYGRVELYVSTQLHTQNKIYKYIIYKYIIYTYITTYTYIITYIYSITYIYIITYTT